MGKLFRTTLLCSFALAPAAVAGRIDATNMGMSDYNMDGATDVFGNSTYGFNNPVQPVQTVSLSFVAANLNNSPTITGLAINFFATNDPFDAATNPGQSQGTCTFASFAVQVGLNSPPLTCNISFAMPNTSFYRVGLLGAGNFSLTSATLSFDDAATPEPGTFALLGLGLAGVAAARFRRTRG